MEEFCQSEALEKFRQSKSNTEKKFVDSMNGLKHEISAAQDKTAPAAHKENWFIYILIQAERKQASI